MQPDNNQPQKDPISKMFLTQRLRQNVYPGQPRSETTLRVVYKHIVSIMPFLLALFLVSIATVVGVYYLGNYQALIEEVLPVALINLIGFSLIVVLVFLFIGIIWIWRRNKMIITDQHIVDIDQIGLFNRKVSTLRLEEIQDVSVKVSGPMQTLLQYGTINIQTAGERRNFEFDYIANPYELEQYILEIRSQHPS